MKGSFCFCSAGEEIPEDVRRVTGSTGVTVETKSWRLVSTALDEGWKLNPQEPISPAAGGR